MEYSLRPKGDLLAAKTIHPSRVPNRLGWTLGTRTGRQGYLEQTWVFVGHESVA